MIQVPKPIAITKDTVVLTRAAWTRIVGALDDPADRAAVRASKAAPEDALPVALYRRIRSGEHPARVWRAHRGLGLNMLADKAGIARGYLSEIETWKKPGSIRALHKIAGALNVSLDEIAPRKRASKT